MLELVYENQTVDTKWPEEFFRGIITHVLARLDLDNKKVELGLHLVLPEKSQELNKQYRNKDKPTDVLSFPLDEHGLEKYGILPLGDIFICLEVAQQQTSEMNIPLNQELARLVVHGILHLIGYDHELSLVEEKKMIDLQEEIVNSLSL